MARLIRSISLATAISLAVAGCAGRVPAAPAPTDEPVRLDGPSVPERQRPEFERIAKALAESANPILGLAEIAMTRSALENPALVASQRLELTQRLAEALLKAGEPDEALAALEPAFASINPASPARDGLELLELRALVHLRRAEVQNCVRRHAPDCCIFPLAGEGVHAVREPAEQARRDYLAALRIEPRDLATRWLLNIATMALGDYPAGVPEAYRIPPSAFESEYDIGRFPDVAPRLGLDTFDQCGGALVEDFDGDGFLDVVTSTFDPGGPLKFHRNRGDGGFEDRAAVSRLDDQLGGLNIVAADYDNDGRRDVLVLRGAWLHDDGQIRNSLLHGNADGTFTDVTRRAGLADPARPTQTAAWGDFDNDGDLDLFVGNESRVEWDQGRGDYPSQLFRNNGDGTFTDVAAMAGVTNDRFCKGVAAGDFDNDGDLDLYLSNIGRNRLYRNEGGLSFTDVATGAGVTEPEGRSFATWFFDFDNDGWLDLFVAGYEASVADLTAQALGIRAMGQRPRLYRNRGDGGFEDVTARAGLDRVFLPMGANFGDLDNDGHLDIYLGTGDPNFRSLMPNVMLRHDGAGRFQDVTTSGGFGHLQKGHGIAFADIDNDGDQDVFHQVGGFYPGDGFANALFLNPGHGNRFVIVELVGSRSNRDAIGARIRVILEGPDDLRTLHRAAGAVSSFGGSPIRQEIGLGRASGIQRIDVDWPVSGERHRLSGVPLDSRIRIIEGREGFERLELRRVPL